MKWKYWINLFVGLRVTVFCVWLAFRKVLFTEITNVISGGEKYSVSSALAITLIAHIVYYILSTLLGIIGLWRIGQSFAGLMGLVARKNATV